MLILRYVLPLFHELCKELMELDKLGEEFNSTELQAVELLRQSELCNGDEQILCRIARSLDTVLRWVADSRE